MQMAPPGSRDRLKAVLATILAHAMLGYALLAGLAVSFPQQIPAPLKRFIFLPRPAPVIERPLPPRNVAHRSQGSASPPNLRAVATQVVVPPIIILRATPPPVIVTFKPSTDVAPNAGASQVQGPGSGSGGTGEGSGSGGQGEGDGGGGGTPLRQVAGRITGRDYPERPYRAGIGGTLYVRYVVGVRGRVSECSVVRSSGNAELDEATCRLITERFRYRPRRNAAGKPIPTIVVEDHTWVVDRPPPTEKGVSRPSPDTPR